MNHGMNRGDRRELISWMTQVARASSRRWAKFAPSGLAPRFAGFQIEDRRWQIDQDGNYTSRFHRWRGQKLRDRETDFEGDLPVFDLVLLDAPTGFDNLEPA